jgi:hypothetical protein
MDTKVCKKCGTEKPLDLFYNMKKSKDGKCFRCKVCMNVTTYANLQKKRKPKKDWSTEPGFKICRKCLTKKPITDFNIHYGKTRTKDKMRNECRDCQKIHAAKHYLKIQDDSRAKGKIWYQQNKTLNHGYHLKRKFNLSRETYQEMLDGQGGRCKICGYDKPRGRYDNFSVDHDHKTGEIRGLLCAFCNTGIGQFQDSPSLLRKAATYLETF